MASEKQITANRANAQRSTGPRTWAGRARSSRNAYRHGLSVPMQAVPQLVEKLAKALAGNTAGAIELGAADALAAAQLELKRIRTTRMAALETDLNSMDPQALRDLLALERYERLALSRRKAALRRLGEVSSPRGDATGRGSDREDIGLGIC
jgi:hypothetical protein